MQENVFYLNGNKKDSKNNMIIKFESGIIGFELCKTFLLKPAAGGYLENVGECFWLESLEIESIKLLIVKSLKNPCLIKEEDIINISEHLRAKRDDLMFCYIVTLSKENSTLNVRAPLVIDKITKQGWQFILGDEYNTKQFI